jgi:glycosyltransferase involved in cell wall biosynthesis
VLGCRSKMLRRRIYYKLKPYLPWRLRNSLRRLTARRLREASKEIWPINEAAAAVPPGWPGWPDGKHFAFVLTHDVEGPRGLAKSQKLAELEMATGFRSSFNFIPEGDYFVPPVLRDWLSSQGFEIGVHDLLHDGELYFSRSKFRKNAKRINGYLRDWKGVGFRSGFMLRELDWIHDLDIKYDASTFDTDPFEPQPDAAGTIFPYWVPAPGDQAGRPGYVELPYSLPQDSTLFLVLRETTPDIWIRKLDWIAANRGMALIIVHPDYLRFDGESMSRQTYPVGFYRQLLEHVRDRYGGAYWQPLPRDLAAWFEQNRPANRETPGTLEAPVESATHLTGRASPLRGKRAAVLLYSHFPSDPRPSRAAAAMVEAGMEVDLICLTDSKSEAPRSTFAGVRVYRLPMMHSRGSVFSYLRNYGTFLAKSFWFLVRHGFRRRFDVIHVHNMPDVLVFAALIPKLRGARVILDLHDPMPELMTAIYGLKPDHWPVRLLRRLERWSIGFSDLVLTPNISFKTLFASRSCIPDKIHIVMNSPEEKIFNPDLYEHSRNGMADDGTFKIMHHGSLLHRHGVDLLIEAVAHVRPRIPGIQLHVYGAPTPFLDTAMELARSLGLADVVRFHGRKSQAEIADAIRRSHLGVVPNRRSVFTEINFPTRLFEYLALYRPVIAPATQGIRDYFKQDELLMFEPDSVHDMASKILWVSQNAEAVTGFVERGNQVYRQHLWQQEKIKFVDLLSKVARQETASDRRTSSTS